MDTSWDSFVNGLIVPFYRPNDPLLQHPSRIREAHNDRLFPTFLYMLCQCCCRFRFHPLLFILTFKPSCYKEHPSPPPCPLKPMPHMPCYHCMVHQMERELTLELQKNRFACQCKLTSINVLIKIE
jgi:hypothetical protein